MPGSRRRGFRSRHVVTEAQGSLLALVRLSHLELIAGSRPDMVCTDALPNRYNRVSHLTDFRSGSKAKLRMVRGASYNMLIPEWREATQRKCNKPCPPNRGVSAQGHPRVTSCFSAWLCNGPLTARYQMFAKCSGWPGTAGSPWESLGKLPGRPSLLPIRFPIRFSGKQDQARPAAK